MGANTRTNEILSGWPASLIVIIRLDIGLHSITDFAMSLWTRKPAPFSWYLPSPLYRNVCPSFLVVSPIPVHLTSSSPSIDHLYLLISWSSCSGFPKALRVLTFHVPMLISLLVTLILVLFPVVWLSLVAYFLSFSFSSYSSSITLSDPTLGSGGRGRFYPGPRPIQYWINHSISVHHCRYNGW